ncbi:MAG: phasin family protein, partial [Betaproteobacteria bacterium]|nr:phasin family protein [Betaproteobacteria bacterium]
MHPATEQIIAGNKARTDALIAISNIQVAAFERLSALTFNAARAMFEDSVAQARAMLGAKDEKDLFDRNAALAQPAVEKAIAYSRSMYDVAVQAQNEISRVMETHCAEMNRGFLAMLDKVSPKATPASEAAAAAVKSAFAAASAAYSG